VEREVERLADRLEPEDPVDDEDRQEAEIAEAVLGERQAVQAERGRGLDAGPAARFAGGGAVRVTRERRS